MLAGVRLFVDLERLGKAVRQAGRNTFISAHQVGDVGRVKAAIRRATLMVRVNPLNPDTAAEVDAVLAQGADWLMLPMFNNAVELRAFARIVAGRAPVVALLETAGALASLDDWITTPGLHEVYVGLNDLHHALGLLLVRKGDKSTALQEFAKASMLAPADARYAYVYGIALNSIGKQREALSALKAADTHNPNNLQLLSALISILRESGDIKAALVYARKVSEVLLDNEEIKQLIVELEREK